MRKSIQLKNEKAELTSQYRQVLDRAEKDNRATNTEEREQLAKMDARFDALDQEIAQHERQESREAEMAAGGGSTRPAIDPTDFRGASNVQARRGNPVRASQEYAGHFRNWLTGARPEDMPSEIRNALTADSDTGGGYTVASEQFADRLLETVDNQVFIRRFATITQLTSAQSLGVPTRDGDVDDADWTSEVKTGSEDTGLKFGKREFRPHPLAKRVKLSKKLLRLTPWIEDKIIARLSYKFGVAQEQAFLLGDGVQKPLGLFVASSDGISTGRDVLSGSTTGFPSSNGADALIDALYTLKPQYQTKATWIFHRDVVRLIRKIKDSYGQYVWQPGIAGGQPDTILNRPFFMSEYAPNTLTAGKYIGLVGDLSKYEIVEALNIEIQRLIELYAEANQIGYIGRMEVDGMPVLEEAFVRIKTSAS